MTARIISWFSRGAASAVAAKMTLRRHSDAQIVLCETGSEHADNKRFEADCVHWFNRPIEIIQSEKYRDTWHVWEDRNYMAGINGAVCTVELKFKPRLAFQRPDDVHVFGYTADLRDMARAQRLRDTYPELTVQTPLIEAGLTKAACIAMIENAGIQPPAVYRLGFQNANCIPCVKATSPNYWSLVRKEFPAEFQRASDLSRQLGARLCRIDDERRFIDEIPVDWPTTDPIAPSCDFLCHLAEQDIR